MLFLSCLEYVSILLAVAKKTLLTDGKNRLFSFKRLVEFYLEKYIAYLLIIKDLKTLDISDVFMEHWSIS